MRDPKLKIYQRGGEFVPAETIILEYQKITSFLAKNAINDKSVGIKQTKDYRYLLTMLACMEIGIPYVPMKNDFPSDRVEQIREDAEFNLIVDDALVSSIVASDQIHCDHVKEVSDRSPLYMIFTSGSTGKPKGVVISRGAASNFSKWMQTYFKEITENDRMLQVTQFTFDISLVEIFIFLEKNVSLYFSKFDQDIFKLAYEIEQYKITALSTVPNNLNMLLEDFLVGRADYSSLKELMIGGARFSYGLYEKCLRHLKESNVYNFYGPTECTIYSHIKKMDYSKSDLNDHNISIGTPVSNVTARLANSELLLGGAQVMNEYVNNPEKTSEALIELDGSVFYRTGDISFVDEIGQYYITGRMDDTIKYRGYRINLLDIDSYVSRLEYVQDCTTIAIPDDLKENLTVCYVILNSEQKIEKIKEDLSEILLDYQIPEKFIFTDKFPVNVSGKVCKKQLKEQYERHHA